MTEDDLPLDDSEFHDVDYGESEFDDSEFEDDLVDEDLGLDGSSLDDSVMRELAVNDESPTEELDGEELDAETHDEDEQHVDEHDATMEASDAVDQTESTLVHDVAGEADLETADHDAARSEESFPVAADVDGPAADDDAPEDDAAEEDDELRSQAYESIADEILAAAETNTETLALPTADDDHNGDSDALDEDLLADDSQPSPQLWSQDIEIPAAATPVAEVPVVTAPVIVPRQPGQQPFVRKTKARELALQMLFQADLNPESDQQDIADQLRDRLPQADLYQFAWDLYCGVLRDTESLDRDIAATATNWRVSRMAATDRNVIRLGVYELLHMDTPFGVVLDEAIDLAKKFGTSQSASFVNGVLDKLVPDEKRPTGSNTTTQAAAVQEPVVQESDAAHDSARKFPATSAAPEADMIPANASPEDVAKRSPGKPISFKRKKVDDVGETAPTDESSE